LEALKVFILSIINPFKAFRTIEKKWGFRIYWFTALLILLAIGIYSFTVTPRAIRFSEDTQDSQVVKGKEALPGGIRNIQKQVMGQLKQFSNIGSSGNIMQFIFILASPLVQIISWLLIALIYWGFVYIFRNKTEYSKILTVVVISAVPILISTLVNLFYTLFTGKIIIHTGLSGLVATGNILSDAVNPIYIVLSKIDIFILWSLILLILGIVISCKVKVLKAISTVLIVYILGFVIAIIPTLISGRLLQQFIPQLE